MSITSRLLLVIVFVVLALQSSSSHAQVRSVNTAPTETSAALVLPDAVALLSASPVGGHSTYAAPVTAASLSASARPAPWWATSIAVAGPLADGLSTYYAIKQSGPRARVTEGNAFYHQLFGSDVKPAEILAFKVAQAALAGASVHWGGKHSRKGAIGAALVQGAVHSVVSVLNMKNAAHAKRLNAGRR